MSREFSDQHPEIPWADIVGMRHKVVHDYLGVDEDIVWQVVIEDLPTATGMTRRLKEDWASAQAERLWLWIAETLLDALQLRDIESTLRPARAFFHGNQVIDGGDQEGPMTDSDRDRPSPNVVKPFAFAHQEIDVHAAVWRPKVECQHSFFALPGWLIQAWHDIDVEGDPRAAVERGSHATDNHELNVLIVQVAQ